jgi:hypothetical protein
MARALLVATTRFARQLLAKVVDADLAAVRAGAFGRRDEQERTSSFVPALIQNVRRLNAWEIVRIRSLDDARTILEPMARRGPCDYSNRSSARLLRLSGGGTRLVPAVRNRLPERVVIDAADHINSFSDLEMKSK